MKAIISLALLLGLLTISCKKEVQTAPPITDSSAIDSMNANSTSQDTTGATSRNQNDSVATINMKDSAGVSSK